jgi:hypothetical protein
MLFRSRVAFAKFAGGVEVLANPAECGSSTSLATKRSELVLLTLYAKGKTDNIAGAVLKEIRRALED